MRVTVQRDGLGPVFRMALLKGATTSVLLHLRRGASINGRDARGLTPLMIAAGSGREDVCRLLLAEGADRTAVTAGRQTACELALAAGYLRLGDLLFVTGAPATEPGPREDGDIFPGAAAGVESRERLCDIGKNDSNDADGGWEAEDTFRPAQGDAAIALAVTDAQSGVSATRMRSAGDSWNEVRIELPRQGQAVGEDRLRVTLAKVDDAFARERLPQEDYDRLTRRLPGLSGVLEDLGVIAEPDALAAWISSLVPALTLRAVERERLTDAVLALEALAGGMNGSRYGDDKGGSRQLPDRDAEQSMFRALRDGRLQVLRLLAALPSDHGMDPYGTAAPAPSGSEPSVVAPEADLGDAAPDWAEGPLDGAPENTERNADLPEIDVPASNDLDLDMVENRRLLLVSAGRTELAERLSLAVEHYLRVRNRVVEAYLPLVTQSARRFVGLGILFDDLVQEGNIGLIRAVERFDLAMGFRFATMAVWWVRKALGRANDDLSRMVRLPVHVADLARRVDDCSRRLALRSGREPGPEELAAAAGLPVYWIDRLNAQGPASSIEESETACLVARLKTAEDEGPFATALARERRTNVSRLLGQLGPREEKIVRGRFGIGEAAEQTLEEIGQAMGVTRERIRQIEHKAMLRLSKAEGRFAPRLRALL